MTTSHFSFSSREFPKEIRQVVLDGRSLTIPQVVAVARNPEVKILFRQASLNALKKMHQKVREKCEEAFACYAHFPDDEQQGVLVRKKSIYGVTTGFGAMKKTYVKSLHDATALQKQLILSHSAGVGEKLTEEEVRAMMLIRMNTLMSGRTGVRPEVVERLKQMLQKGIHPEIPSQGSVGASGDLAPLAHLALAFLGEGEARIGGKVYAGSALREKMKRLKMEPSFRLAPGEGIAFLNGTSVMTAIAVLACYDAERLLQYADLAGAMTLEAILGSTRPFDERVEATFATEGQRESARRIRHLIRGSQLVNRKEAVHDVYSIRCIPQVHGTVREALRFVRFIVEKELNAVSADPIFFTEEEIQRKPPIDGWLDRLHFEVGNFHGQSISLAMDTLGIALTTLGAMSERRIQVLLDKHFNEGLPPNLIYNPEGLYSGLMLSQYTAASLVSENKVLAHPASVDSIPTSAGTEDFVSMGTTSARKARTILQNVEHILAIELLCATQALSFRTGELDWEPPASTPKITGRAGEGTTAGLKAIRQVVPPLTADRRLDVDILRIRNWMTSARGI